MRVIVMFELLLQAMNSELLTPLEVSPKSPSVMGLVSQDKSCAPVQVSGIVELPKNSPGPGSWRVIRSMLTANVRMMVEPLDLLARYSYTIQISLSYIVYRWSFDMVFAAK